MDNLDSLQIEGFHTLLMGLDEFFEEESITFIDNNHRLELFSSAILESIDIIRSSSNFHGKLSFSNIIVSGKKENKKTIWYDIVCIDKIKLKLFYDTNLYLIY